MKTLITLLLLCACDARLDLGRPGHAQGQVTGGGLRVVSVLDGGVCSGLGTKATPLDCELTAIDGDGGVHGTGTAGDPLTLDDGLPLLIFGDGSDGDLHVTTNTNIVGRDVFYDDVTIDEGVFAYVGGFRVHIRGTLTLNGIMYVNGNNGANGPNGSTTVAACQPASSTTGCCGGYFGASAGTGGGGNLTGGVGGSQSSSLFPTVGIGGAGAASTGTGNNGADRSATQGAGGGGASGGGFVGTPSGAGGNGGGTTVFATDSTFGGPNDAHDFLFGAMVEHRPSQSTSWVGSGGGGGGGSCGKDTVNPTLREPAGGAGGGAAGSTMILARRLVLGPSGGFQAKGGNGGNGGSCGTHTGDAGGGGGGGGGSGGTIYFMLGTGTMPDDSKFDVSGGLGGTGGTGCVGGPNGGNGGNAGFGRVYKWRADGQSL